ncbi:hypothetical protein [Afipia sp. DC4300-2b1]|uniref:hypothetical protein n=1 Tax=Afipia sp. DC4300-2b1 TaxID=2804672 RepID=UPI003CF1F7F7
MSEHPKAKMIYLTEPKYREYILNVGGEDGVYQRVQLTELQLSRLVDEGAGMLRGYLEERA